MRGQQFESRKYTCFKNIQGVGRFWIIYLKYFEWHGKFTVFYNYFKKSYIYYFCDIYTLT